MMNKPKQLKRLSLKALISINLFLFLYCVIEGVQVTTVIDQSKQWMHEVHAWNGIPYVDNITYVGRGVLIATLELKTIGRVVVIDSKGGVTTLLDKLNRPDGLLVDREFSRRGLSLGRYLYVTQEVSDGSVIRYDLKTKQQVELFKMNNPEGIDRLANGSLVVSEDILHGNVYWIDSSNNKHILIANLNRPEGLCVAVDGSIYVAETGRNRVIKWSNGKLESVVTGLKEPDQVECHVDGSVWITEDATPGRLLRLYQNKLYLIADSLSKPQGIAFAPFGVVFIAEQGKHRIVKFRFTGR